MLIDLFILDNRGQNKIQATLKAIRYLGIWIACNQQQSLWISQIKFIIQSFIDIVQKKKLGIRHVCYLVNRVLNPKLTYVAQLMTLEEREWDMLF